MSVSQNLPNITIGYSRGRLLMFFGGNLLLTLLCAGLAFTWQQGKGVTTFELAACYVGAVFFGLATCRMLWRLTTARQPVVFITRVGIRDTRLAEETIAWSAVRKILLSEQRTQKCVVLKVDPLIAQRCSGGFLTRALMNKALGADGVIVNAGGLTMDVETLLETCKQYWGAGRPAPVDEPVAVAELAAEPVN
ncbi:STM3941 family protein [Bradyrhizobium sp. 930_D9_N1_4]|uniref:STM3941 family protein n=1 Tax=Bradyrhizobium sp. 930_D9_N1_4 TaxID=3240374 RepID=UPI003F8CC620